MEGRDVTLRGKISETYDNLWPGEDFGNELVLDPQETVFLLTLRQPVCLALSPSRQSRPVVQPRVTIVELLVNDAEAARALRAQAGKTTKVEGKISENVWWHYKATMRLVVKSR